MLILAAGIAFLLKKAATVAHLHLIAMRNTPPAAYTVVPVTITGMTGHVPGIVGHVRPESLVTLLRNTHYRISMPQCTVLAEINRQPNQRFALYSQVHRESVAYEQFSGMSGGPIFWSDDHKFGIYGIVYEGGVQASTEDKADIYVFGELATPDTIRSWIKEIPALKF